MHMTIQLLLILFIAFVVVAIVAIILFSRYFYLRGVRDGYYWKEQIAPQRTNVFTRLWEPSAKRS